MQDKLSKEEVLHVAELARIEIDNDELESYQIKLKQLLDEVKKIDTLNDIEEDILIAPVFHNAQLRDDEVGEMLDPKIVVENAPRKSGNYIKVPVIINE